MSRELNVNGNICEILETNFEYTNKHKEILEDEYDSRIEDYRDTDQEERTNYINDNLSKLAIHEKVQKLNLNDVMMDFGATSLYPSAMWDEESLYPKNETGFVFKHDMNETYVDAFNNQTFNQNGNESAILEVR